MKAGKIDEKRVKRGGKGVLVYSLSATTDATPK